MSPDTYYERTEVSNSDLSSLDLLFSTKEYQRDATEAYRFGSLLDATITEAWRVNYFKRTLDGEQYSKEEFDLVAKMKRSFFRDKLCRMMAEKADMQKVSVRKGFKITYRGVEFELDVRCKWDLFIGKNEINGDIKSTTATTQDQFLAAVNYFKYFKQRAFYMDIEGTDKDLLIGVSKVNYKVFKVPVVRGDKNFLIGQEQYQAQAFRYWQLFNDFAA